MTKSAGRRTGTTRPRRLTARSLATAALWLRAAGPGSKLGVLGGACADARLGPGEAAGRFSQKRGRTPK